jgi:hypothetical protein
MHRMIAGHGVVALTFICLMLIAHVDILTAQTASGRLLDAHTDQPIPGATVVLVDRHDDIIRTSVTGGVFALSASREGRYRLRAQAIGYMVTRLPPVDLVAGEILPSTGGN